MFQAGQRIRTTDKPLSDCLRNQRGVIVERYTNPLKDWTGPVEYLVRFDNGSEYYIAETFLRVEYLERPARHALNRVYRIEDATSQTIVLIRRDGTCSRRVYLGEFGGMPWGSLSRKLAAKVLRAARRQNLSIDRTYTSGR